MMADIFQSDVAALYDAVSKGDGVGMVLAYAKAARKAVTTSSSSVGRSHAQGSTEEKVDEYYSSMTRSSPPNPFLLRQQLHQAAAPFSLGSYYFAYNSSNSQQPSWNSGETENGNNNQWGDLDAIIEECCLRRGEATGGVAALGNAKRVAAGNSNRSPARRHGELRVRLFEGEIRYLAKVLSDSRPPTNFVYTGRGKLNTAPSAASYDSVGGDGDNDSDQLSEGSDLEGDDQSSEGGAALEDEQDEDGDESDPQPVLFDGSNGGGSGSLIHLACIVDSPFALALLLVLGAEAAGRHTAFRRLPVHEASCSGSIGCLTLLLEVSRECVPKVKDATGGDCSMDVAVDTKVERSGSDGARLKVTGLGEEEGCGDHSDLSAGSHPKIGQQCSFSETLRLALDLVEKVARGAMSELDASRALVGRVGLPRSVRAGFSSIGPAMTAPDGHGNTALHWAAFKNAANCVSVLLDNGGDPNARAQHSGWTPLHDAAYSDAADAAAILLQAGANVDARANSGATPLCFAAQEDSPLSTALLLRAGADAAVRCCGQSPPNSDNTNTTPATNRFALVPSRFSGYTPLHYCAHYNASGAAKVLIEHGSPIELEDLSHRRPIHVAVARGSSDVLRELLAAGATVETNHSPLTNPDSHAIAPQGNSTAAVAVPSAMPQPGATDAIAIPGGNSGQRAASVAMAVVGGANQPAIGSLEDPRPAVISPVSSPVLKAMVPNRPIQSSKPWNCLSQTAINECNSLLNAAEGSWSPRTHGVFAPTDRRAVLELLRVGKRLEQLGTGIFVDLWPYVLSFCGRGWFLTNEDKVRENDESPMQSDHESVVDSTTANLSDQEEVRIATDGLLNASSDVDSDVEFTQFHLESDESSTGDGTGANDHMRC